MTTALSGLPTPIVSAQDVASVSYFLWSVDRRYLSTKGLTERWYLTVVIPAIYLGVYRVGSLVGRESILLRGIVTDSQAKRKEEKAV